MGFQKEVCFVSLLCTSWASTWEHNFIYRSIHRRLLEKHRSRSHRSWAIPWQCRARTPESTYFGLNPSPRASESGKPGTLLCWKLKTTVPAMGLLRRSRSVNVGNSHTRQNSTTSLFSLSRVSPFPRTTENDCPQPGQAFPFSPFKLIC